MEAAAPTGTGGCGRFAIHSMNREFVAWMRESASFLEKGLVFGVGVGYLMVQMVVPAERV